MGLIAISKKSCSRSMSLISSHRNSFLPCRNPESWFESDSKLCSWFLITSWRSSLLHWQGAFSAISGFVPKGLHKLHDIAKSASKSSASIVSILLVFYQY